MSIFITDEEIREKIAEMAKATVPMAYVVWRRFGHAEQRSDPVPEPLAKYIAAELSEFGIAAKVVLA